MARQATARWVTLDEVVKEYISQAEQTTAHYRRLWNLAFRGLEDMSINIFQQPKSVRLSVLPNKTVALPSDYIAYTKIGVFNEKGEVATLSRNDNMSGYNAEESTRTEDIVDVSADLSNIRDFVYLNYDNNGGLYNLQGIGSFLVGAGEFKTDETLGLILLEPSFSYDYIVLEYLASPREDTEYKVPIQLKEALIAWIGYADIEYKVMGRKFQETSKAMRWKQYVRQKKKALRAINPVRMWEANDLIRAGEVLAVKG